jgi:hypothetical protein
MALSRRAVRARFDIAQDVELLRKRYVEEQTISKLCDTDMTGQIV